MRHTCSVLWVLSAATCVFGNTEILNFAPQDSPSLVLPFTEKWPLLSEDSPSLTMNATSASTGTILPQEICHDLVHWTPQDPVYCPHELWLVLDLDAHNWRGFRKFTLRLSWPASQPTDINMKIFDPDELSPTSKGQSNRRKTRRKYARIQFSHYGVLTPNSELPNDVLRYQVSTVVVLEPLHLGVLPSSVVPVVIALFLVILAGIPLASKFDVYLRSVAQKVREDERLLKSN